MTRINLVPPSELTDQHLFAEFREIKRVPKVLLKSLQAYGLVGVCDRIPKHFTLGTGHVTFFYNKGVYLANRYQALREELHRRGVNFDITARLDPDNIYGIHPRLQEDYVPTPEALTIIRERIATKIAMKPTWYRHTGAQHAL
jgi:deoxyribonuclease (pyrimidine dimer)